MPAPQIAHWPSTTPPDTVNIIGRAGNMNTGINRRGGKVTQRVSRGTIPSSSDDVYQSRGDDSHTTRTTDGKTLNDVHSVHNLNTAENSGEINQEFDPPERPTPRGVAKEKRKETTTSKKAGPGAKDLDRPIHNHITTPLLNPFMSCMKNFKNTVAPCIALRHTHLQREDFSLVTITTEIAHAMGLLPEDTTWIRNLWRTGAMPEIVNMMTSSTTLWRECDGENPSPPLLGAFCVHPMSGAGIARRLHPLLP